MGYNVLRKKIMAIRKAQENKKSAKIARKYGVTGRYYKKTINKNEKI